jgi:hypothetical protein
VTRTQYDAPSVARCTAMVAGDRGIDLIEYSELSDLLPRLTSSLAKYTTAPLGLPPR